MTPNIRQLDPKNPKDQQLLAKLETQAGPDRLYLVSPTKTPDDDDEPPEDILDEKSSTKATLDHLGRLIIDQRIDVLHCDPADDRVWVRGRIDGQLQRIGSLPAQNYADLVGYLKVQAGLDLADDVCQTGPVVWSFDDQALAGQLQTTPTVNGEKLTFRRQTKEVGANFGAIGFWGLGRRQLEQALGQTRGLVLFVSPDQASRQLCLETAEALLAANPNLSLASLVDQPTGSYDHQTLLKPEWGRTRQQWLKTQAGGDNDVLLVDQLIDQDSCQLAVEAALNNKLVLSSLAGQTPNDGLKFLTGQGVDPHLLVAARPTLAAVWPVRKLKPKAKPKKRPAPAEWLASPVWEQFDFDKEAGQVEQLVDQAAQAATEIGGQLNKPAKTDPADDDYRGQILLVDVRTRPATSRPSPKTKPEADKPKAVSLERDGLIKIVLGLTSAAEVEQALNSRQGLPPAA